MALLCAAVQRDSVSLSLSLVRFPFFNHVQVFSCEISIIIIIIIIFKKCKVMQ